MCVCVCVRVHVCVCVCVRAYMYACVHVIAISWPRGICLTCQIMKVTAHRLEGTGIYNKQILVSMVLTFAIKCDNTCEGFPEVVKMK